MFSNYASENEPAFHLVVDDQQGPLDFFPGDADSRVLSDQVSPQIVLDQDILGLAVERCTRHMR